LFIIREVNGKLLTRTKNYSQKSRHSATCHFHWHHHCTSA